MNDYVVESGDVAFAKEKWGSLQRAYEFLRSTYDEQGLPKNFGIGHGWVEGGPLLPVKTELYQSALGIEALRALGNLAVLTGNDAQSKELQGLFAKQQAFLNDIFWVPETKRFAFALDQENKRVDQPTVLSTVPMWFGLLDEQKANSMIDELAKPSHQSDWGMRIIAKDAAKYSGGGYHFGAVWPLFTGWASIGEYEYHRAIPAYANLRANALLALDGAMGHTTEVLSGDYYSSLSTSSPHQIWSAAMVVSPILRGMLGFSGNALTSTITFAPHVPAGWEAFSVRDVRAGHCRLDANWIRDKESVTLEIKGDSNGVSSVGGGTCTLVFSPAFSRRAKVSRVTLDGKSIPFHMDHNSNDQHARMDIEFGLMAHTLRFLVQNDFAVSYDTQLPQLGSAGRNLHIVSEEWAADGAQLTLHLSGVASHEYFISVSDASQIASVDGGKIVEGPSAGAQIRMVMPNGARDAFVNDSVTIHFGTKGCTARNSAQ